MKHPLNKRVTHPDPFGPRIPRTRRWYDKVRARVASQGGKR